MVDPGMTTIRKFCRFNKRSTVLGSGTNILGLTEVPEGGICLSTFLLISKRDDPESLLMGHLNPHASWDHIGALDQERIEAHSKGWMLPSCHLILHESPDYAARRIVREQLELEKLDLTGPKVISEVYRPKRFPDLPNHWDLEFIYNGTIERPPRSHAWKDLQFVNLRTAKRSDFARSHEDIIESMGYRIS